MDEWKEGRMGERKGGMEDTRERVNEGGRERESRRE